MNAKQLQKLGVPPDCVKAAMQALGRAADQGPAWGSRASGPGSWLPTSSRTLAATKPIPVWGELARELLAADTPLDPRADHLSHLGRRHRHRRPRADAGRLPGAECGRRRAHARRPRRLRPADRRRAGLRERRDSVRGRRRHRLPHEALGARPAGRVARDRFQSLQGSAQRRHEVRRRRRAPSGPIARRDGPRLERHAHHAREERTRPGSSSARAARATTSSSSAC